MFGCIKPVRLRFPLLEIRLLRILRIFKKNQLHKITIRILLVCYFLYLSWLFSIGFRLRACCSILIFCLVSLRGFMQHSQVNPSAEGNVLFKGQTENGTEMYDFCLCNILTNNFSLIFCLLWQMWLKKQTISASGI